MGTPRLGRITREHVIHAAETLSPKRVQKWSCTVPANGEEKSFPERTLFRSRRRLAWKRKPCRYTVSVPAPPARTCAKFQNALRFR